MAKENKKDALGSARASNKARDVGQEEAQKAQDGFINATVKGFTELNEKMQQMELKLQERDKLINDMATAFKSQQDVLANSAPVVAPQSEAERNQPLRKGDLYEIVMEGVKLLKQGNQEPDELTKMAVENFRIMLQAFQENVARSAAKQAGAPGVN